MTKVKQFSAACLVLLYSIVVIPPSHAAPPMPTNVRVVDASLSGAATDAAQVQVTWTAVTGALAYVVSATATGEIHAPKTVTPGTANQVIFDGLSGGVSYSFVVSSKDSAGETAAPAVTFVPHSVSAAPTIGKIIVGKGQLTLNWTAPTNTGGLPLTNYLISATGLPNYTAPSSATSAVIPDPAANPAYTLSAGSTYTFQITATNSLGSSVAANYAPVTMPNRPSAPTGVSGTVSGSTISATWIAPVTSIDAPITGYTAHLYDQSNNELLNKLATPTGTTYDFTGLAAGTYSIKVTAINIGGESDLSAASTPQVVATSASVATNNIKILPTTISDLPIDNTVDVTASADSGGTVTLTASPSAVCSINSGTVLGKSAGRCTITGTAAKSGNYDAGLATRDFYVVKVAQSINFATIPSQTMPGTVTINATSSSSMPVVVLAEGSCTISGLIVTLTGAGTCTLTANSAESSKYLAATSAIRTFTISASSGGGGGVGGGGGGASPPPTPSPSPTPTLTPTPSASPTPSITSSASPTPTHSPSPTPTPTSTHSPTPTPAASVSPSPTSTAATPIKPFQVITTKPTFAVQVSGSKAKTTLSVKKTIQITLGKFAKGTLVRQIIRGPTGTFKISSAKLKSTGIVKSAVFKFAKPGTYTYTTTLGKIKKVVTIKVTK